MRLAEICLVLSNVSLLKSVNFVLEELAIKETFLSLFLTFTPIFGFREKKWYVLGGLKRHMSSD